MIIRRKNIKNIEHYLSGFSDGGELQLSVPFSETTAHTISKLGFGSNFLDGDTILPTPVGPVSRFNSNGDWKKLRHLPKETRFINSRIWRWKEWRGRDNYIEREEERDIYRDCYQKEFISPPSHELCIQNGRIFSKKFKIEKNNFFEIKHAINLMLEIFGVCYLESKDFKYIGKTRNVNWFILPQGENPWIVLEKAIKNKISAKSLDAQRLILERARAIQEHNPATMVVGLGGFSDYVAYVFDDLGVVILESIQKDNAIYILPRDWESFSKLSKSRILNHNFHLERIIHSKGWKQKLNVFVEQRRREMKDAK